jgi:hypothetical protein
MSSACSQSSLLAVSGTKLFKKGMVEEGELRDEQRPAILRLPPVIEPGLKPPEPACVRWPVVSGHSVPGRRDSYMQTIGESLIPVVCKVIRDSEGDPAEWPLSRISGYAARRGLSVINAPDMKVFSFCIQGIVQFDRISLIRDWIFPICGANRHTGNPRCPVGRGCLLSRDCIPSHISGGPCFDGFLPA